MRHRFLSFAFMLVLACCLVGCGQTHQPPQQQFEAELLPPLPAEVSSPFFGVHNGAAVVADGDEAWALPLSDLPSWQAKQKDAPDFNPASLWHHYAALRLPRSHGASASGDEGIVCIGGIEDDKPTAAATLLYYNSRNQTLGNRDLPDLPATLADGNAASNGPSVYVTNGQDAWSLDLTDRDATWKPLNPMPELTSPVMAVLQGKLYLFGLSETGPKAFRYEEPSEDELDQLIQTEDALPDAIADTDVTEPSTTEQDTESTADQTDQPEQPAKDTRIWHELASPPGWLTNPQAQPYHLGHIFIFGGVDVGGGDVRQALIYHAITDTWITVKRIEEADNLSADELTGDAFIFGNGRAMCIKPSQLETNYGWLDNAVVAVYLLGMIGVGWYFTKRENSANDFFRGGQRIPWWAAGMSLFATGASAISLAGMPGMGFGTDWTYFSISIYSALCLPIGIFIMAPLVRRLNIATANEYLERRFGVTSRLFASTIFMFTQIAARIASVMLLSAIALEAITDMDIITAIIVMGVVTTIYTYLGGLEAVIWTDTIQGFVMVSTVVGCLILALFKLDMPFADMWTQTQAYHKFHMFDFNVGIVKPTAYIFFINVFFTTCAGISDQNFVQRVQSTPDLKQTKMAVATQMAVAVPINVLLFSLGTALWLFYRAHPASLSPTILNNDGIFPFFAAQQLPIGVSGIVVAALLAATMSTVSSSICAVSDLGTNDFYKRFKPGASDHQCLILGRVLTAVVGIAGTACAILMSQIQNVKSVWDLAIMVTGLISSSVLGLFLLGLITRKSHELGALFGAAVAMIVIVILRTYYQDQVTFWLYIAIGPIVTILVGSLASLVLPGKPRETRGLTLFSLRQPNSTPGEAT